MSAKITVSAEILAPVDKVWICYTNPQHIVNWNFASDDWQCPKAENDLKVGGRYFARMEAKDGSFGFDFVTIYDVVIEMKELSYTMEDGRRATTIFESKGASTTVITSFDPEQENPIEMQQAGWQMILNNFKKYAEK